VTTRLVRGQLFAFGIVAMVAVLLVSVQYLQIPRLLGWGEMRVSAQLPSTGGLSKGALVTYRGVPVGRVKSVGLTGTGVVAGLAVDRHPALPADVTAQVHDTSAIGEQYLELLPTGTTPPAGTPALRAGAAIPATANPVPVDAGTLLQSVDSLITSVNPADLRTTVDELDTAFDGAASPLAALLDGGSDLVGTAQANLAATKALIANLQPVLTTQRAIAPDITGIASNLASFTGQLKLSDGDLRALIAQGPAAAEQITDLVNAVHPALPMVLANLAATGEVLRVYLPGIKQILVIYPALIGTLQSLTETSPQPGASNLYFHLNINDPKACRTGFTGRHRDPSATSDPTTIDNGYCKVGATSQLDVRGTRNSPCPNGGRSATAAGCGLNFTAAPKVTMTTYDPVTGDFTGPDGKLYRIDLNP
jgi:phospholipid/cholesterol/gamma-HCH transport system substrate-binding protein